MSIFRMSTISIPIRRIKVVRLKSGHPVPWRARNPYLSQLLNRGYFEKISTWPSAFQRLYRNHIRMSACVANQRLIIRSLWFQRPDRRLRIAICIVDAGYPTIRAHVDNAARAERDWKVVFATLENLAVDLGVGGSQANAQWVFTPAHPEDQFRTSTQQVCVKRKHSAQSRGLPMNPRFAAEQPHFLPEASHLQSEGHSSSKHDIP